jgi:hypothetical protein
MRAEPDPYPLAPGDLRDLAIDVLNWLGWEFQDVPGSTAMRLGPPGADPILMALTDTLDDAVRPATTGPACATAKGSSPATPGPAPPAMTRITLECPSSQEAIARILLDEIHGAIQRRTEQERTTT